jgi:periplasmic protein TonB
MNNKKLTENPEPTSDLLLVFIFCAALLHLAIILGVSFTDTPSAKPNRSLEITLARQPSKQAPSQAKMLAQENQIGSGAETVPPERATGIPVPADASPGEQPDKAPQPRQEQAAAKPVTSKVLSREQSEAKTPKAEQDKPDTQDREAVDETKPLLSPELLQQQIAQLGQKIREVQGSETTKIRYANEVSAKKFLAAQYVRDWQNKVERTGNLNYPDAARHNKAVQTLTMDVAINADGSIYSLRITKSSGNPALDDAAKQIVKMSAPFPPLPTELMKELNILVVTRVWKFSDETGMSAR